MLIGYLPFLDFATASNNICPETMQIWMRLQKKKIQEQPGPKIDSRR